MADEKHTADLRPIPDFPGYLIGRDGSVWSRWKLKHLGRPLGCYSYLSDDDWYRLQVRPDKYGYMSVGFHRDGRRYLRRVHCLLLKVFVGPRPKGMLGLHKDDNKTNNELTNLYWGTPQQNMDDKVKNGNCPRGSQHSRSKLTDALVLEVMRLLSEGRKGVNVAAVMGVSQVTVSAIKHGRIWGHLTGVTRVDPRKQKVV